MERGSGIAIHYAFTFNKGSSMGNTVKQMNYKGYETYEVINNYVDNNRAEFGNMTASYDRINTLEVRKSNVEV